MNWADSQIQEYSEKAKEQQPYGSRITLLFGLTMVSFFIVTYMTINNFAFRALCVRYLFSPLPWLVVSIGYVFCIAYLLLAFYSFLVYFRIAKPVGKGLNFTQLTRLGLAVPSSTKASDSGRNSSASPKTLLPLPAWATEPGPSSDSGSARTPSHGARSPVGSSRFSLSSRKQSSSVSSPTSPKGRSKGSSPSRGTPAPSFSWINTTQTPTRLSSPLNYPKNLSSPSGSTSRPLSPTTNGTYTTSKVFPKMESPMVRRTGEAAEAVIYSTTPLASPAPTHGAGYYASPSNYYTPGTGATPRRGAANSSIKSPTGGILSSPISSPLYTSPRATANFSIESYTSTMSPLASHASGASYSGVREPGSVKYTPSNDFSFADETQLDEYIERQRRIETTKDYLNTEQGGRSGLRNLKMPAYQSMAIRTSSDKPSNSKEGAYNDDGLALAVYAKEGVSPFMDAWSENMRAWLSAQVLKPLTAWFEQVVEHMGKDALYQAQLSQVQSGVQKLQSQTASMFSVKPTLMSAAATTTSTQSQQQQQQFLEQRMRLERLFGDFGASREYVVERIRALAQGAVLQSYNWSAGGKWKDKEWSTDLPTDAHLLCHLFCTHLDELVVPTDAAHLHDAFRSRYFFSKDETARKPPTFGIVQKSVNPPHYNVVVNQVEWNVLKGRNNLFDALCLFIYVVRKDYKGVLDQRYLGGRIRLLEVLTADEE